MTTVPKQRNHEPQTLLLILPKDSAVVFVTDSAFRIAQATRSELRKYIGAMVVSRNGTIRRISAITALRPWGTGWMRRIWSALTSAWAIETCFSEPEIVSVAALRELRAARLENGYFSFTTRLLRELPLF